MDVISSSPVRVASVLWQSRSGAFAVMFVCPTNLVSCAMVPGVNAEVLLAAGPAGV